MDRIGTASILIFVCSPVGHAAWSKSKVTTGQTCLCLEQRQEILPTHRFGLFAGAYDNFVLTPFDQHRHTRRLQEVELLAHHWSKGCPPHPPISKQSLPSACILHQHAPGAHLALFPNMSMVVRDASNARPQTLTTQSKRIALEAILDEARCACEREWCFSYDFPHT